MARRALLPQRRDRSGPQDHRERLRDTRSQRHLYILACEGEKTECLYFEAWFTHLEKAKKISIRSCVIAPHQHTNPTGVLDDLVSYRGGGLRYTDFEERWIVIDRDEERTGGGGHTRGSVNFVL